MLIKIYSAAPVGIDAVKVTIEVHSKPGFEFGGSDCQWVRGSPSFVHDQYGSCGYQERRFAL